MPRLTIIPTPPTLADEVCDFCSSSAVDTVFLCTPGAHPVRHFPGHDVYVDDGEWNACAACAELIRAQNRSALAWRALDHLRPDHATGLDQDAAARMAASVQEMQTIFWSHLVGERPVA